MKSYEMKNLVDDYIERHNLKVKKSYYLPFSMIYEVTTTDYTELNAKLSQCKNGNTKLTFKVDNKVTSVYK